MHFSSLIELYNFLDLRYLRSYGKELWSCVFSCLDYPLQALQSATQPFSSHQNLRPNHHRYPASKMTEDRCYYMALSNFMQSSILYHYLLGKDLNELPFLSLQLYSPCRSADCCLFHPNYLSHRRRSFFGLHSILCSNFDFFRREILL